MAPGYHTPQDNMNNFVMADMHQGMNAVWGLLAPLALGLEADLLTSSTRQLQRGFLPPFTFLPLTYSPLAVPSLTSPTITSTPFQ